MDLTESIPIFTCGSTNVGAPRCLASNPTTSLTGPDAKLRVHQTVESWVSAYMTVQPAHGTDHTSLLVYSGAP